MECWKDFLLFQSILHRKEKHFLFSFAHYCCNCQLYAFQQQVFTKVVCSVYAMDMISSPNISNNYVATFIENEPNFFSFLESSPHGVPLSCMELPSPPWHLLILHIPSIETLWVPTIEALQSWHLHWAALQCYTWHLPFCHSSLLSSPLPLSFAIQALPGLLRAAVKN